MDKNGPEPSYIEAAANPSFVQRNRHDNISISSPAAAKSFDALGQRGHFRQPKTSYADDKGQNVVALKREIEDVYAHGMSKLMDESQMELTKLNALQKQLALEEEQINIQRIQNRQKKAEQQLKQLRD